MTLNELLKSIGLPTIKKDTEVTGIESDSRKVKKGCVFVAVCGQTTDGHQHIQEAIENGAAAIIGEEKTKTGGVPFIEVSNSRFILARLAQKFYTPLPKNCLGITGENGKTSTAFFTHQLLDKLGHTSAHIGTFGVDSKVWTKKTDLTTPDCATLLQDLHTLAQKGVQHACIEASANGLEQQRLDGVTFKAVAITKSSPYRLGAYKDTALQTHAALLSLLNQGGTAVLDATAPDYDALFKRCKEQGIKTLSYGTKKADIRLLKHKVSADGQRIVLSVFGKKYKVFLPIIGDFQVFNVLAAVGLTLACGQPTDKIISLLPTLTSPPGRMELVAKTPSGASVFVDYAHTPNALIHALKGIHRAKRLFVILGCGGNRPAAQRELMGKIAQKYADRVIVTDDNPRNEDPAAIRGQILKGCPKAEEIANRKQAIQKTLARLKKGDVLIIEGKGHETTQQIQDKTILFNDKWATQTALLAQHQKPIWTKEKLKEAISCKGDAEFEAFGVSIDTRTLQAGDLFVAIGNGEQYLATAFEKGAVCAIVSHKIAGYEDKTFIVKDVIKALQEMATYVRYHTKACIIGITGSSGKTTTKELLTKALSTQGVVHATFGNQNNLIGAPLTLAKMPENTRFAVVEMGMNHTGELTELGKIVCPDITIITNVHPAHHEFFKSQRDIALAKAELLAYTQQAAILNQDNDYFELLKQKALKAKIKTIYSFGRKAGSSTQLITYKEKKNKVIIKAHVGKQAITYTLKMVGMHFALDSLAALTVLAHLQLNIKQAVAGWCHLLPLKGRGLPMQVQYKGTRFTLIDDSYNANPASMRMALNTLKNMKGKRKVAILGDMLELGDHTQALHNDLLDALKGVDVVYAVGPNMTDMFNHLPDTQRGASAPSADEMIPLLCIQEDDIVLAKGSHGSQIWRIVEHIEKGNKNV